MKTTIALAAFTALALSALTMTSTPAAADDAADCTAGIAFLKAELAKNPTGKVLASLQEALKDAEREADEGEYDECLDAVQEGRDAVAG